MISILVVEDNLDSAVALTHILETAGYHVELARDGKRALALAQQHNPQIILLDVLMPEMDGFGVCRVLKANKRTAAIPIVFLTVLDDIESKVRGFEVGGVDYITKPFFEEEVLVRVRTHLILRNYQLYLEKIIDRRTQAWSQEKQAYDTIRRKYEMLEEEIFRSIFYGPQLSLKDALDQYEEMYITRAYFQHQGELISTAAELGISPKTLRRRCRKYGISLAFNNF